MGFGRAMTQIMDRRRMRSRPSPWSWDRINANAPPIQQTNAYQAAFGKQADPMAQRGLPTDGQFAPGPYNAQAYQLAGQAPQQGWNVNLGSGAMPELDNMSRYGSGITGLLNRSDEALDGVVRSPQFQQVSQAALSGLLGGQVDPRILQGMANFNYLGRHA